MAPAAAPEAAFKKDEKVFCFHHELLYEAKVLEVRPVEEDKKNGYEYRVHYKGWKNTYVSPICLSLRLLARHSASYCGSHVCPPYTLHPPYPLITLLPFICICITSHDPALISQRVVV